MIKSKPKPKPKPKTKPELSVPHFNEMAPRSYALTPFRVDAFAKLTDMTAAALLIRLISGNRVVGNLNGPLFISA